MALMHESSIQQAEKHVDIAVRWALASANAGQLEKLPRHGLVEPRDVDAGTQLTVLAGAGRCARCHGMVASRGSCLLKLLGSLVMNC